MAVVKKMSTFNFVYALNLFGNFIIMILNDIFCAMIFVQISNYFVKIW